jgi:hypothetical protein
VYWERIFNNPTAPPRLNDQRSCAEILVDCALILKGTERIGYHNKRLTFILNTFIQLEHDAAEDVRLFERLCLMCASPGFVHLSNLNRLWTHIDISVMFKTAIVKIETLLEIGANSRKAGRLDGSPDFQLATQRERSVRLGAMGKDDRIKPLKKSGVTFSKDDHLGEGSFGNIYLGCYEGDDVAVKMMDNGESALNEVDKFTRTSGSVSVLRLAAFFTDDKHLYLVLEVGDRSLKEHWMMGLETPDWMRKKWVLDTTSGVYFLRTLGMSANPLILKI